MPSLIEQLADLASKGHSRTGAARIVGLSPSKVRSFCADHPEIVWPAQGQSIESVAGRDKAVASKRTTPEKAAAMRASGKTARQLAAEHGLSVSHVRHILSGRKGNGRPPLWTPQEDAFIRQHGPLKSCKWIAEKLGRSTGGIHGRAKRLGVNMVKQGEAHWNARCTKEIADMIGALNDAGFKPIQIHLLVSKEHNVSRASVEDICAGRTWRNHG